MYQELVTVQDAAVCRRQGRTHVPFYFTRMLSNFLHFLHSIQAWTKTTSPNTPWMQFDGMFLLRYTQVPPFDFGA